MQRIKNSEFGYLGNPSVKRDGVETQFTKEEVLEQLKEFSDNALESENSKEPEKPKTTQEHFDECLRHWSKHG